MRLLILAVLSIHLLGYPIYSSTNPKHPIEKERCEQSAKIGWCDASCSELQPEQCCLGCKG